MIHFKPLQHVDIGNAVDMMQRFYAIDNYPMDVVISKKLFETFISNENLGLCWLIYENENLVGYIILTFVFSFEYKGRIAFLDELYIENNFRGRGIGNQTLNFIKSKSESLDLKVLYLEVENHNNDAQSLYLKNGFELHNRQLMKFRNF